MEPVRLHIEPRRTEGGQVTLAGRLEHPDGRSLRLWWRIGEAWSDALTDWADPFVVGFAFPMMQWGLDVEVEGRVSPSLLGNLETFTDIWGSWIPEQYQAVRISARQEIESPRPPEPQQAVTSFSCGVDSCFTVQRHCDRTAGRASRNLTAGVVMNGFDVWLDQENASAIYDGILKDCRVVLASKGLDCISMTSNFHDLPLTWGHAFGTHLVSGLGLLAGRFDTALIPSSAKYRPASLPHGDHPMIDPYLSGDHFRVADDAGNITRVQKAIALSQWPEAMRYLRVCFPTGGTHANCCECEKCIRTFLAFKIAGVPTPSALGREITDRQIRNIRLNLEARKFIWMKLVDEIDKRGLWGESWAKAVRTSLRRNRIHAFRRGLVRPFIPLRNRIRTIFRGSPLSRAELAQQSAADPERSNPKSRS